MSDGTKEIMMKKIIGQIGIDTLKIGGWINPSYPHEVTNALLSVSDKYEVKVNQNKAVITFGKVTIVFGVNNKNHQSYVNMTIKAACNEPNLEPMSIEAVRSEVDGATMKLYEVCGIALCHGNNLKITKMDINTTFPLNEKFCAYNRILSLVAAVDVKIGKIKHEISAKDIEGCFVAESLRCTRSTVELAIYNKKKEMQNKGEALVTEELMRVEHRLTSQSAIVGNLKTDRLKDITDEKIWECYRKRTEKIFKKIDTYLDEKLSATNNIAGADNTVANMMLMYDDKGKLKMADLLSRVSMYESHYGVPCLLDITDCRYAYRILASKGYYPLEYEERFMQLLLNVYYMVDGRPEITLHKLRHSCASMLIDKGWNPKKLQYWLGHEDISVTLNIYTHYNKQKLNTNAVDLDEISNAVAELF